MASRSTSGQGADEVPDGALLQLSLSDGQWGPWAEGIPPVPVGARATVTFSSEQAEVEHAEALVLLGYQVLGVLPRGPAASDGAASDGAGTAELVVSRTDLERHSTWFRSLLAQSDRAYDLSLGPVLVALRERWRPHVQAARR